MKRIAAASLAAFSSYGWTQQLVAVAPPADSSGFAVIAAVLVAGAGLVFLKVKRPEVLARLSSKVRSLVRRRPSALSAPLPLSIPVTPEVAHTISNVEFIDRPTADASVDYGKQPPIYGWLISENEKLRRRVAELEARSAAPLQPIPHDPIAQFTGFLKA